MRHVDVIVPVYKGLVETQQCIISAVNSIDPVVGQLIVINDASPEPQLVEWLESASQQYGFMLIQNEENLGFVATVNKGMQINLSHDVLLLNSDVEVSGDWLSRLREGAYINHKTGSVTPFSNNATICSFPNFCHDNNLLFDSDVEELDNHFKDIFDSTDLIEIPTAIGFCMYIRRDCLESVGYFDVETFGKGYGEENDWCQRAEKSGWANYHQANVFAYHKGGVSFDIESDPRKVTALELLASMHPEYEVKVHKFLSLDPAKSYRSVAMWKLMAKIQLPKIVHVSHKLGGGVHQHIKELTRYHHGKALFLLLQPFNDGKSVSLSIIDNGVLCIDSVKFDADFEYNDLISLLKSVGVSYVHFHHTMGLHPRIWSMPESLGCQYDFTVHDYYCVNGNPTLIDGSATFVGDISDDELDRACAEAYPIPVSGKVWRNNKRAIVEGASRVIFPSNDTYTRFNKFFSIKTPIIAWHPDHLIAQSYPQPTLKDFSKRKLKVMVLGALSREKGADLLELVAKRVDSCEFHLLGYAYRALDNAVITHGPYDDEKSLELIQAIDPDVVWYTAQWPETYSYTLSKGLELGLPVVVPEIGAFRERVKNRAYSWVINTNDEPEKISKFWIDFRTANPPPTTQDSPAQCNNSSFYTSYYIDPASVVDSFCGDINPDLLKYQYCHIAIDPSRKERVLIVLWRLSRMSVFSYFLKLIPYGIKRNVKRLLSSRPLHEIVR